MNRRKHRRQSDVDMMVAAIPCVGRRCREAMEECCNGMKKCRCEMVNKPSDNGIREERITDTHEANRLQG